MTDNLGLIELFHEFVSFLVGQVALTPVVYQDSTSVISLVTEGGGITRTKHWRARMHLGKECVDNKWVVVKYMNTKKMPADGASKVLEGAAFQQFSDVVLGARKLKDKTIGGRWKKIKSCSFVLPLR